MDTAVFKRPRPERAARITRAVLLGVSSSALAAWVQSVSGPYLERAAFLLPFVAVCLSAWFGGVFGGIIAGVLGALLVNVLVFQPAFQFSRNPADFVPVIGFAIVSIIASMILARLKGAATKLRSKEEELSDLIENAAVGIRWMAQDGTILWANRAELALLGYAPEEYLGRSIRDFHVDAADEILLSLTQGQGFVSHETRLRARDGSIKTVLLDVNVLRQHGRFVHARCFTRDITERKSAERALQESETKFRTLFEKSLDAIGVSRRGVHVFVNPAYLKLFGYQMPAELLGRPVFDVLAASSRAEVADRIERRARGDSVPTQYEVRALRRDGTEFDLEVNVSMFDLNGSAHTLVIVRDITERKRAERELTSRARQQEVVAALGQKALSGSLSSLYQHVVVMVQHTLDVTHVAWLDVLPGGRELLLRAGAGWPAEWIGHARVDAGVRFLTGYVLASKGAVAIRRLADDERFVLPPLFAERGIVSGLSIAVQSADRSFGLLSAFTRSERDFGANEIHFLQAVAYVMGAAIERQTAEAALREREMLLRRVMDANPNLILVKDREGTILLANEALAATYGSPLDQIIGQSHPELHRRLNMSAKEVAQWLADDREVIDTDAPRHMIEPFTHYDGVTHWYSTRKLPLTLGSGRRCVLIVSADITDHKAAEDEIRKLNTELEQRVRERTAELADVNRELEAFSYSISHDLRAPLRAIDGFSKIITDDYKDKLDADGLRLFRVIRANSQRMGDLIDDLLEFSRLNRREFHRRRVDMMKLARTIIDELLEAQPGRKVRVTIGNLPAAIGDTAMIRQVLVNLLSNALKFTRPREDRAEIEVNGSVEGNFALYSIRDNGVGFDSRYVQKLFQVFQRLHRADEFDGTGVGLAIVQRIVQRHGGKVWGEGAVNAGATFHFTLPAAG